MSGFPGGDLTKELGILGNLTLKATGILLQDFYRTGENRDSSLRGHKQNLVCTKTQKKRAGTPQETEPKLPASVGGISRASLQGWGTGSSNPGRSFLAWSLLEVAINPTIETIDPRTWSPQAQQLPGRECNPIHQQIIGLKLYWMKLCPPEQDPVFLTASLSQQEAYTNLLASCIRGWTEEARRTTVPQEQKKPNKQTKKKTQHITES